MEDSHELRIMVKRKDMFLERDIVSILKRYMRGSGKEGTGAFYLSGDSGDKNSYRLVIEGSMVSDDVRLPILNREENELPFYGILMENSDVIGLEIR